MVSEAIEHGLSAIAERAKPLAMMTGQINEAIERVEKALRTANIGLECWIEVPVGPGLGWAHHAANGEWCLCVWSGDMETPRRLSTAPRVERIRLYPHIPELLRAIEEQSAKLIASIENALAAHE